MTFPSPSSPVPPFHSLGNGTVEQTFNQWNSPRNANGTFSLKALANKVLEQNKQGNKPGTEASNSVPRPDQSVPLCGAYAEVVCKAEIEILDNFEERFAIAEYDGQQNPVQAHRIAYLDAFISILSTLAEDNSHQDWLTQKLQAALAILERQNFPTLT
jgi:hypothetical protein